VLSLITPTGDRPEAFDLCKRWMRNQSFEGVVEWIVVDDGVIKEKPFEVGNWRVKVIQLESLNANTQGRNLVEGLSAVSYDRVVIIEDDDYYCPTWLATVALHLEYFDLVGEKESFYYDIKNRVYRGMGNTTHASLCSTAFKGKVIDIAKKIASSSKNIDIDLWKTSGVKKLLFSGHKVVGIKNLPGRAGIGYGHRMKTSNQDTDGSILKKFIGKDYIYYKDF
jgi:glycosyltransferase involved in cell wall biosynthesis